jgi:signal transduction histidine kinase
MTLKARLQLSIILLNLGLVLLYSMMHVYSITEVRQQNSAERAAAVADQVQSFLQERLNELAEAAENPPQTIEEQKAFWYQAAGQDPRIQSMLESSFAGTRVLSRILLLDDQGRVLVTSNILDTQMVGRKAEPVLLLDQFQARNSFSRMLTIFNETEEIAIERSLASGETEIFKIRVVLSSLLLRDAVVEQLRYLLPLSLVAFALAGVLAIFVSNLATRQLVKVSQAIDRIAEGDAQTALPAPANSGFKEYDVVASKLQMLGQQIRGARQDALSMQESVRQLLARMEKAVLLFDANDSLISAGENVEPLLNVRRFELIGKKYDEIFPPSTKLGALILRAVSLKAPTKEQLVTVERPGLDPIRVYVTVEPMDQFSGWERVGTLVTLRDAESQAVIQSQLDVSTRLAAISRLTSGVAHEIKNPLNAMNLHLEILKTLAGADSPNVVKEIEIIAAEITRLNRVVNTFLDFTRPVDLKPQNLNLADLVAETGRLFEPQVKARGMRLDVVHPPEPVFVRGDRDLLKQALVNLTSNAMEAMSGEGHLLLELVRQREDCILKISDNGCGIPEEIRSKIFQLYFTTKGKGRGTGIGLAMTFQIVQLHGGEIWFESETGRGTTFHIRLPVAGSRVSQGVADGAASADSVLAQKATQNAPRGADAGEITPPRRGRAS